MDLDEVFEKIKPAFIQYYDIKAENVEQPFFCEAEFSAETEQYLLVKSAKISESESNEFVYFAKSENLTQIELKNLSETAWSRGLSKITPYYGHRNSDVKLIIICKTIEPNLEKIIKATKFYKSYHFTLYGWSHFKLGVICTEKEAVFTNKMGSEFKKLFSKLLGY